MPAPEAYRHWCNHVSDEVKLRSDKPGEAWIWLNEIFGNKIPREFLEEKVQDPGSAALTRSTAGWSCNEEAQLQGREVGEQDSGQRQMSTFDV